MKIINRKKSLSILILGMISFTISLLLAQPDEIIINNTHTFINKQRTPVRFPHGLHMGSGLPCKDCHHVYSNGKNVLDESELVEGNPRIKCSSCHTIKKTGSSQGLMDAFHLQCMGCHKELELKGKKSGPRLCGPCHPRK
jgi:hypothetical protein